MRKTVIIAMTALVALTGCNHLEETDMEEYYKEKDAQAILENGLRYFGSIDPNQDWNGTRTAAIEVTADAPLRDIAKVQILTESPYLNSTPTILAEAEVQKGETVQLNIEIPKVYQRLIAACVDADGHYYVKGFNVNETSISFQSSSMTRSMPRRAATTFPDASKLKLEGTNAEWSYNALRTQTANKIAATGNDAQKSWLTKYNIHLWQNSQWEEERLWKPTNTNTGTEWSVVNNTILRVIDNISDEERQTLEDIFNQNLLRKDAKGQRIDNLATIRESEAVKLYNNHLTSDGQTPICIVPVQAASSELSSCHLYYYYYNPNEIPSGMDEATYVKTLPKYKAIQCWHTMSAAGISNQGSEAFFKKHEYLLPYYGEPSRLKGQTSTTAGTYTTDGKLYRFRNGQQVNGQDYYMTFLPDNQFNKMATKYDDNAALVADQLWQIFTDKDGYSILYNAGYQQFLVWDGNWDTRYSIDPDIVKNNRYYFDGENHIWRWNKKDKQGLGSNLTTSSNPYGVFTDKNTSIGVRLNWYLEEYTGNKATAQSAATFEKLPTVTASSTVIPQGYRIGFMLRKLKGSQSWKSNGIVTANNNGCCYGFGGLNKEINNFPGHFGSSKSRYSMEDDDPRVAYFEANGKVYLAFEDGADAQFSDMIIEVSGYDTNVVEPSEISGATATTMAMNCGINCTYVNMTQEIPNAAYTMCFEDRPTTSDYDLNDVVLRCTRVNKTTLSLALVAAGGDDDVIIRGADGWELNNKEVHDIFMAQEKGDDGHRFVNTVIGGTRREVQARYVTVPESMTIPQYLKGIYIENVATGRKIRLAQQGEYPYAIIVPQDFQYPQEFMPITGAYQEFLNWAQDAVQSEDWYLLEEADKVFPSLFKQW